MRIYMPRTLNQLVNDRDLVVLHDAPCGYFDCPEVFFDPKWASWFVKAVQEAGMSLNMWGGDASWGGEIEGSYLSWGETMLDAILPYNSLLGYNPPRIGVCERRFVDPNHPLTRIPWSQAKPIELLNKVTLKMGATPLAEVVIGKESYPWMAWLRSGEGKVLGEVEVFASLWTSGLHDRMPMDWPWYQDFLIYLIYFDVDKPLPEDVYRAHAIREEINLHSAQTSLIISLLEFVGKFGAKTLKLASELDEINARKKEAEKCYLDGDYEAAAEIFDEIHLEWNELTDKAVNMKKKALVWVYLIEWFVITATTLISGVFIWMVITRRMLYREVATTGWRRDRS